MLIFNGRQTLLTWKTDPTQSSYTKYNLVPYEIKFNKYHEVDNLIFSLGKCIFMGLLSIWGSDSPLDSVVNDQSSPKPGF